MLVSSNDTWEYVFHFTSTLSPISKLVMLISFKNFILKWPSKKMVKKREVGLRFMFWFLLLSIFPLLHARWFFIEFQVTSTLQVQQHTGLSKHFLEFDFLARNQGTYFFPGSKSDFGLDNILQRQVVFTHWHNEKSDFQWLSQKNIH